MLGLKLADYNNRSETGLKKSSGIPPQVEPNPPLSDTNSAMTAIVMPVVRTNETPDEAQDKVLF